MNYKLDNQSRLYRKIKSAVINKKLAIHCTLTMIALSFMLLIPVLSETFITLACKLLALCTVLLFGGIVVGLSVSLLIKFSHWLRNRKHVMADGMQAEPMVIDAPRLQHSFLRVLESLLSISAWAFFLNLMQPFFTAIVWWLGYKLLTE